MLETQIQDVLNFQIHEYSHLDNFFNFEPDCDHSQLNILLFGFLNAICEYCGYLFFEDSNIMESTTWFSYILVYPCGECGRYSNVLSHSAGGYDGLFSACCQYYFEEWSDMWNRSVGNGHYGNS